MNKYQLALALLVPALALAQVPLQVHYQGYLTNVAGVPVNAPSSITFRLYDTQAAPTPVWEETHAAVPVANGVYSVMLGLLQPLSLPIFDTARWLGVQAAGDPEMTPRQQLGSAPFAAIAQQANTLASSATVQGSQVTGAISEATMPGAVPWVAISGRSQPADSNTAYMVTGVTPATITLPAAPAVGDVVKVSSQGAGGWTLAPNAGQTISGGSVAFGPGLVWIPRESVRRWISIASSADGTKLVAAVEGGQIYTSTDSGVTWAPRASERVWISVASSADGTKLAALVFAGHIYTSTDSGASWNPRESARNWRSVASSADGAKLAAVVYGGEIYTSPDSGANWAQRESARQWTSVASSADGAKLAASVQDGQIYTSIDSGVTWTSRESARDWRSVASSADGAKLVAVVNGGQIYTSTEGGVTWIPRESARQWLSVASSADGTKLAAGVQDGQIHTSNNGGVTWNPRESERVWGSIVSSADGTKLAAVNVGGRIYTAGVTTISGGQYSAAELVYAGNDQWIIVNQQGLLTTP